MMSGKEDAGLIAFDKSRFGYILITSYAPAYEEVILYVVRIFQPHVWRHL